MFSLSITCFITSTGQGEPPIIPVEPAVQMQQLVVVKCSNMRKSLEVL